MFIGLSDNFQTCGPAATPPGAAVPVVPGGPFCFNHHFDGISTFKIGLNYRFY